jgi:hypothetical protein
MVELRLFRSRGFAGAGRACPAGPGGLELAGTDALCPAGHLTAARPLTIGLSNHSIYILDAQKIPRTGKDPAAGVRYADRRNAGIPVRAHLDGAVRGSVPDRIGDQVEQCAPYSGGVHPYQQAGNGRAPQRDTFLPGPAARHW